MLRKISLLVSTLLVCSVSLGGVACRKIERSIPEGTLITQAHPFADKIPAEYGELKGVFPDEGGAVLVFEKADKTIVMLPLKWYWGGLSDKAVIIPRN